MRELIAKQEEEEKEKLDENGIPLLADEELPSEEELAVYDGDYLNDDEEEDSGEGGDEDTAEGSASKQTRKSKVKAGTSKNKGSEK